MKTVTITTNGHESQAVTEDVYVNGRLIGQAAVDLEVFKKDSSALNNQVEFMTAQYLRNLDA